MKKTHNYLLLVDNYRRSSRQRNTHGIYRVGAKTPKEAIKLLRAKIKFGSIIVYKQCDDNPDDTKEQKQIVGYKTVVELSRSLDESGYKLLYTPARSAIDPLNKYKNEVIELDE